MADVKQSEHRSMLQSYYASLESRIGYRFILGGTRHFGYWKSDTWWPFPLTPALRAMEQQLYQSLDLPAGSFVLDAGCGVGHVAMYMARKGLKVSGIDIVARHALRAAQNVSRAGLSSSVDIQTGDYHHLPFPDASFDGMYTMETFVHAFDPEGALREFWRVLRPGAHLAMHEYDHVPLDKAPSEYRKAMLEINFHTALPGNTRFEPGVLQELLADAGFVDVRTRNMSENITPMTRLFYVMGFLPWLIVCFFGLQKYFINTVSGVQMYRGRDMWRYISVTARKPEKR